MSITDITAHVYNVVSSDAFREKRGLGNEIPFFICPYNPQTDVEMNAQRHQLVRRLKTDGIDILDVNLYDLAIGLLREEKILKRILDIEVSTEKDSVLALLRDVLDPEAHIVPAIKDLIDEGREYRAIFLSGVGEVYPYIRSHSVLNNLQIVATSYPTILFFPGNYRQSDRDGMTLELFGRMKDDKYYRAFNIMHYSV